MFLPGWEEITSVNRLLQEAMQSRGIPQRQYVIHSLHSQLPSFNQVSVSLPVHRHLHCGSLPFAMQRAVFNRPAPGVRKIVLSTNIAETSVTIDDVVFVIDAGRQREKSYNSALSLQVCMVWDGKTIQDRPPQHCAPLSPCRRSS